MAYIKRFLKKRLKAILLKVPFINTRIKNYEKFETLINRCGFEPGHFYSTIPIIDDVIKNRKRIFENQKVEDIDLQEEEQFDLLQQLKLYYASIPYKFNENESKNLRYKYKDAFYRYSDVIFLFSIIRHYNPKRIIEIGSGHSSAVMLDINELFYDGKIDLTFIEPYPEERLIQVMKDKDYENAKIVKDFVQNIDVSFFQSLGQNDILFVDSSHVSKVGSDVNYIFFDILPHLGPGVLIHFHDIFYPFEMPETWITQAKFFWNENYLLRAFLMNNKDYVIVLFNSFMHKRFKQWFEKEMPLCLEGSESTGSIWLRKVSATNF